MLFVKLRCFHEIFHVIRFGSLKLLPLPETRNLRVVSNLSRDLRPAGKPTPKVPQQVGEAFLSHLWIWYVKRHWSNMVYQRFSGSSFDKGGGLCLFCPVVNSAFHSFQIALF